VTGNGAAGDRLVRAEGVQAVVDRITGSEHFDVEPLLDHQE